MKNPYKICAIYGVLSVLIILTLSYVVYCSTNPIAIDEMLNNPSELPLAYAPASDEMSSSEVEIFKINLNTASIEMLCELDGIGNVIATRIVEFRKVNGNFTNIEGIKEVSGIGDKKFDKIKDKIIV